MLIGDEWSPGSTEAPHEHIYPATGEAQAEIAMAGAAEVDRAVRAGNAAQRAWWARTADDRRDSLLRLGDLVDACAEELSALSIRDNGVPAFISAVHAPQLVRWLRYYAGWVDKRTGAIPPVSGSSDLNLIERVPYGVVGVIIPWNGPLFGIAMAVAPALAAGNAVVLKPPELAPLTSLRFGELCLEAGLPPGLVNVLPGGAIGGEAMVRHPGIAKIHFTGSGAVARMIHIAAAENLTPVATELGGKSAQIIFDDVDLDAAAGLAAFNGPLAQSGQSCACGSRILVQSTVHDAFVERLAEQVRVAKIGDPTSFETVVGPVISAAARAPDRRCRRRCVGVGQRQGRRWRSARCGRLARCAPRRWLLPRADDLRWRRSQLDAGTGRDVRSGGLGDPLHRRRRGDRPRQRDELRTRRLRANQ